MIDSKRYISELESEIRSIYSQIIIIESFKSFIDKLLVRKKKQIERLELRISLEKDANKPSRDPDINI